jgi:hypothetical protein
MFSLSVCNFSKKYCDCQIYKSNPVKYRISYSVKHIIKYLDQLDILIPKVFWIWFRKKLNCFDIDLIN